MGALIRGSLSHSTSLPAFVQGLELQPFHTQSVAYPSLGSQVLRRYQGQEPARSRLQGFTRVQPL